MSAGPVSRTWDGLRYRAQDHDEYAVKTRDFDAAGFDYVIGDPALVNGGLGTAMPRGCGPTVLRARRSGRRPR